MPRPAQQAQIDEADARSSAAGDRERLEKTLSGVPKLFASVDVKVEYVKSEVTNPADWLSKVPPPPFKAPSLPASSSLSPPAPDPADSVPPSVVSEHPAAIAVGDREHDKEEEPDVASEIDWGGPTMKMTILGAALTI